MSWMEDPPASKLASPAMMLPATTYEVLGKENQRVKLARAVLEEKREMSGTDRTGEKVLISKFWVGSG